MDDKRIRLMRDEKVSTAIIKMSVPAIIGLLVMAVYNIVDTMFVAWLGTEATGATQVVMPVMMLISSFGLMFGMGGASYISRLLGKGQKEEADKVGSVALHTSLAAGLVFTVLTVAFMEPLLRFFGASDALMSLSKDYGLYILLGSVFQMSNMTMNNMLRAEGSAKLSMIGMGAGALLNIILDPIFIFGLDLGIAGAAMATSLSQVVTFIILITRYLSHHSVINISFHNFKPSRGIYGEMFKVGIPTFFRQVLFSVSLGIMNNQAGLYGGPELLAAVGLVFKITMLPMYVVFGIGQGFQPVAGYNFGAGAKKRVMDAFGYSVKLSLMVSVFAFAFMSLFAVQILNIFRAAESVMAYGILGIRLNGMAMMLMAVTNTIGVFYQALGKGKESLFLSVARQGMLFIPAVVILPVYFGTDGILSAQLVSDILTLVISGFMIMPYIRNDKLARDMELAEASVKGMPVAAED